MNKQPQLKQLDVIRLPLKRIALVVAALTMSALLQAQSTEFQVLALSQKAGADGNLPATTYRPTVILFSRDFGPRHPGGNAQWVFGALAGASKKAHYLNPTPPGDHYGGSSGSYSPGGAIIAGLRYHTTGTFQFRAGLDLRLHSDSQEGSSGDTGSRTQRFSSQRWATAQLVYVPSLGRIHGLFGLHAGFSDVSAPAPNHETGLFAGIRF